MENQKNLIYDINDKPPFGKTLLFAFQMVLSCFVASVLIANICGVSSAAALVGAGVGTLLYLIITKFQSPMFVSSSGAFVAPVLAALSLGGYTGAAIGGLTACVIYCLFGFIFSKIEVEKIYKVFPKALIGAVTAVIGINLMPYCLTYVQINGVTNGWGLLIAFISMFSIALISHYAKGISKILPFLLGTLIGYVCAIILTVTGVYPIVDFSVFENVRLFQIPDFGFFHLTSISWSAILSIVAIYVAYTISAQMECLSDHAALGGIIGTDLYRKPGLGRIYVGEGLANLFNGLCSGLGSCSYGEGVSCVGFSKVAATKVTAAAAIIMAILGFIGPIQAFVASIPSCVFCGAAIILYSFIAISGIKMLQNVDLNDNKNLLVAGVALSLGLSGIIVGGATFSLGATALALVGGIVMNLILKENKN